MPKKIVTQEDLDNIPGLKEAGVEIGQEIDAPDNEETLLGDDVGGSKPPDGKEKPDRP